MLSIVLSLQFSAYSDRVNISKIKEISFISDINHDCNCGHENCNCQNEEVTVTLTLDNDEELECVVLTIYEAGGHEYIALLPIDEDSENDEGDVFIYRYAEVDGEPTLDDIEDDDEYEVAADAFDEWLDAQEFEDMDED